MRFLSPPYAADSWPIFIPCASLSSPPVRGAAVLGKSHSGAAMRPPSGATGQRAGGPACRALGEASRRACAGLSATGLRSAGRGTWQAAGDTGGGCFCSPRAGQQKARRCDAAPRAPGSAVLSLLAMADYEYELRHGDAVVATGRLAQESPPQPGDVLELAGRRAVVRDISPATAGRPPRIRLEVFGSQRF